jgi:hypothetical protein
MALNGRRADTLLLFNAVLLLQLYGCRSIQYSTDCTSTETNKTSRVCLIIDEKQSLCGNEGTYYPDSSLPVIRYQSDASWGTIASSFCQKFKYPNRFKVVHAVFFVGTLDFDSVETSASDIGGASIYGFDSAANEFRVFNYYRDSLSIRYVPIQELSFRLGSVGTKAFTYFIFDVLPYYGIHARSIVLLDNPDMVGEVRDGRVYGKDESAQDEEYLEAVAKYESISKSGN